MELLDDIMGFRQSIYPLIKNLVGIVIIAMCVLCSKKIFDRF